MAKAKKIEVYDTTLRDGAQAEEVSFSLDDKLRLTQILDDLGVGVVEGGYPGSNDRDAAYFQEVKKLHLKNSVIAAFGATHHPKKKVADDTGIKQLLKTSAPVVTVFGKCWRLHARSALGISGAKNIEIIHDTISYLSKRVDRVIFDAEHFFDGFKDDPEYAISALNAAREGGADLLALCETNGGAFSFEVHDTVSRVAVEFPETKIGIHCHNDSDSGVANTIEAVRAGAVQVQGTINGIGERCGNANLCSIIPNLQLKMGYKLLTAGNVKKLRNVSGLFYELSNMARRAHQPYVGKSAFAHKGGMHVSAVRKNAATYEHIEPALVGNGRRVLVSDLSGRGNVLTKAEQFGIDLSGRDDSIKAILKKLKEMEAGGYLYEGADASFELLMRKATGEWSRKFGVERARVISNFSSASGDDWAEAVLKLKMPDDTITHAVAEGNGPVNALDKAVRQALVKYYPEIAGVELHDFKVRLLDENSKTASMTRVLIESGDGTARWNTVGVSANVIEASWQALLDSLEYRLQAKFSGGRKKRR